MAIRLEHKVGAIGGLSAFATGVGKAQERKKKYRTDLMQTQQARADKYGLTMQQHEWDLDKEERGMTAAKHAAAAKVTADKDAAAARVTADKDAAEITATADSQKSMSRFAGTRIDSQTSALGRLHGKLNVAQMQQGQDLLSAIRAFGSPDTDWTNTEIQDAFKVANAAFDTFLRDNVQEPETLDDYIARSIVVGDGRMSLEDGKPTFLKTGSTPEEKPLDKQFIAAMNSRETYTKSFLAKLKKDDIDELSPAQQDELDAFLDRFYPIPDMHPADTTQLPPVWPLPPVDTTQLPPVWPLPPADAGQPPPVPPSDAVQPPPAVDPATVDQATVDPLSVPEPEVGDPPAVDPTPTDMVTEVFGELFPDSADAGSDFDDAYNAGVGTGVTPETRRATRDATLKGRSDRRAAGRDKRPPQPTHNDIAKAVEHKRGAEYKHGQVFKMGNEYFQWNANSERAETVDFGKIPPREVPTDEYMIGAGGSM